MPTAIPSAEPGIDMDTLFKKLAFEPHTPAQWEYCRSKARFSIPCCGRRWGKSQAAGHRMTYKMFIPDAYNWIVGPTYSLGEKEFRVVFNDFRKLGLINHCRKSYSIKQGDMRIETPWKSVLEVKSAEKPDGLLGEGLTHAIMSEAARHSQETWMQYVEPALSDLLGTCDFPSTPKGFNWYHGLFTLGQSHKHDEYKSWTFPSWTNPVRFPGGLKNPEIQRLKAIASKIYFNQEYGADFTSVTGSIYEEWDDRVHVAPHKFNPQWPNYLAFDYGFDNPFVCLDIQVGPDDTVYVWREYYERFVSTHEHGLALKSRPNPKDYNVSGMWGDPRGADEAATLALTIGHVASTDMPWKHGVEQIKRMLKLQPDGRARLYVDPSCENLIRQMRQLHVKQAARKTAFTPDLNEFVGDGNIQHKVDDHAADALRYFIGPFFVLGANSHLSDVYGTDYSASESASFLKLHNPVTLTQSDLFDDLIRLK